MAHLARLEERVDKVPVRVHLEGRYARLRKTKGVDHPDTRAARAELTPPDYPHAVHYLREWWGEVTGNSGFSPDGKPVVVTHTTIRHWAENTGRRPAPHDVRALIEIDRAWIYPPAEGAHGG